MTIYWGRPIPAWIIFTVMITVAFVGVFLPPDSYWGNSNFEMESVSGGVEDNSPLDPNLPHSRYKAIEDSMKMLKWKSDYFTQQGSSSSTQFFLGIGLMQKRTTDGADDYFISLQGYRLGSFTEVDNTIKGSVLSYPVWDKVDSTSRSGHLVKQPIGIKYNANKEVKDKSYPGTVLIPISRTWGTIMNFAMWGLTLMVLALALYTVIYMPFRLLYNLSKGKAFTDENVGILYFVGWVLVTAAFLHPVIQIGCHLLLRSKIPEQIEFGWYHAAMFSWKTLVVGLAVLLLAKAFVQGMEIQEEQQLTV